MSEPTPLATPAPEGPAPRAEVAAAFAEFLRRGAYGRDWPAWAEVFTDDAVYTEHCLGRFHGVAGVRDWIVGAMAPVACMTFSIEWWFADADRVAFWIWNHLPDPTGEGREFAFANLSVLTYAGGGRWSAEEDFYDPAWSEDAVIAWFRAGGRPELAADASLRPTTPSHPPLPDGPDPERSVVERALDALVRPGWVEQYRVIGGKRAVLAVHTDERPAALVVHVAADGTVAFSQHIENPRESLAS